eukprot:m.164508 g.164508  ORF g.164508 m.164508 type:complete len:944 (+) comp12436_c0_seq1:147-2978(+)
MMSAVAKGTSRRSMSGGGDSAMPHPNGSQTHASSPEPAGTTTPASGYVAGKKTPQANGNGVSSVAKRGRDEQSSPANGAGHARSKGKDGVINTDRGANGAVKSEQGDTDAHAPQGQKRRRVDKGRGATSGSAGGKVKGEAVAAAAAMPPTGWSGHDVPSTGPTMQQVGSHAVRQDPSAPCLDVVLLVDTSRSAAKFLPQLQAFCRGVIQTLGIQHGDRLEPTRMGIVAYGSSVLHEARLGSNAATLVQCVDSFKCEGGVKFSPPLDAARHQLAYFGRPHSIKMIILQTSGADSDAADAVERAQSLVGDGVHIIPVAVGAGSGDVTALAGSAGHTRGIVHIVKNHNELPGKAEAIIESIQGLFAMRATQPAISVNGQPTHTHGPQSNGRQFANEFEPGRQLKLPKSTPRVCAFCGERARCACPVCCVALYCNRECQIKHYAIHQPECASLAAQPLMALASAPLSNPNTSSAFRAAGPASAVSMAHAATASPATATTARVPRIFCSYVGKEGRYIFNVIVGALAASGFNLIDTSQLSEPSKAVIDKAVWESDMFLAVLTPSYFDSIWCVAEARAAAQGHVPVTCVLGDDTQVDLSAMMGVRPGEPDDIRSLRMQICNNPLVPVISTKDQVGAVRNFVQVVYARLDECMKRHRAPVTAGAPPPHPGHPTHQTSPPTSQGHHQHPAPSAAPSQESMEGPNLARLLLAVGERQMTREQAVQYADRQYGQPSAQQKKPKSKASSRTSSTTRSPTALSAAVAAASAAAAHEDVANESASPRGSMPSPGPQSLSLSDLKGGSTFTQRDRHPTDYRELPEDDSWMEKIPPPPVVQIPEEGWASIDEMIKASIPVEALGLDRKRFNRWKRVYGVAFRGEDQKALTRIRRAELARLHARVARKQRRLANLSSSDSPTNKSESSPPNKSESPPDKPHTPPNKSEPKTETKTESTE